MFTLYKTSLDLAYIPRFFRILSFLFIFVFIGALIGEILLKLSLDQDIQNLKLKKDLLRNSESRDFQLLTAQSTIRLYWELSTGGLDPAALGDLGAFLVPLYGYFIGTSLKTLATINKDLLADSSQLDQEMREFAFLDDVKVYDNYFDESPDVYVSLNNFQALDRIIETGLTIVGLTANPGNLQSIETARFLFRNMLNDILIKNSLISAQIMNSLDNEYSRSQLKIDLYLVMLLVTFGSFLLILAILLWRQYHKEVNNLSALCRLDQNKLAVVLQSFLNFKDQLENQDFNLGNIQDIQVYLNRFSNEAGKDHAGAKREGGKNLNANGINKKYYIHLAKLLVLIFIMFGVFIANSLLNSRSVDSFKSQQTQIYFTDHGQTRVSLLMITARELYCTNNIAKIENLSARNELEKLFNEMVVTKQVILDNLVSVKETEHLETINTLVYGDACPLIDPALDMYCQILKAQGQKTGLIYMMDSIVSVLKNQLELYDNSDKSEAEIKELKAYNLELQIVLYAIETAASSMISSLFNQSFEDRVDTVAHNTLLVLVTSIIVIVFVGVLLWKLLLKELREGVVRFKGVLKVLPPELVLSSFILKTFLVRTSQGLLETIKHEL